MISRNWPNEFVRACATISLLLGWPLAGQNKPPAAQTKTPAVALLDPSDTLQWQNWTREAGWQVIVAAGVPAPDIDSRLRALVMGIFDIGSHGSLVWLTHEVGPILLPC